MQAEIGEFEKIGYEELVAKCEMRFKNQQEKIEALFENKELHKKERMIIEERVQELLY